jgi:hypothetical protein
MDEGYSLNSLMDVTLMGSGVILTEMGATTPYFV